MPFKPSKEKSPPSSDPAFQTGPMMQESLPTKVEYSCQTGTTSDKTSSNYTTITQQRDTLAT